MLTPPPDLTDAEVAAAVGAADATYFRFGFGSHHWLTGDAFVTVDDLDAKKGSRDEAFAALVTTLDAVSSLGLDFAVTPVGPVRRLTERYALAVYPLLDVRARDGDVLPLLNVLHATPPPPGLPVLDIGAPARAVRALLGHPLVASHAAALERAAAEFEGLLRAAPLVVTHGEPKPGNVVTTADGVRLIDWDTAALAPRERDLCHLDGIDGDPGLLAAFRLRWELDDVRVFVRDITRGAPDALVSRDYLRATLDGLDKTDGWNGLA